MNWFRDVPSCVAFSLSLDSLAVHVVTIKIYVLISLLTCPKVLIELTVTRHVSSSVALSFYEFFRNFTPYENVNITILIRTFDK